MAIGRTALRVDRDRFLGACREWHEIWGVTDRVLRDLCRKNPRHAERGAVTAKVLVINRAYSAGLERIVKSDGRQASSLRRICDYILEKGSQIDELIESLPSNREELCPDDLAHVVEVHGRFVHLLSCITRDRCSARSFCSKYLYFHRPITPMYDDVALKAARRIVGRGRLQPICEAGDKEYRDYIAKYWTVLGAVRSEGLSPTVKEMDDYLLWEAYQIRGTDDG